MARRMIESGVRFVEVIDAVGACVTGMQRIEILPHMKSTRSESINRLQH